MSAKFLGKRFGRARRARGGSAAATVPAKASTRIVERTPGQSDFEAIEKESVGADDGKSFRTVARFVGDDRRGGACAGKDFPNEDALQFFVHEGEACFLAVKFRG